MHLLAEGVEAEAEAFGHVLLAAAVDEDGAEGFVETLGVARGLKEEEATRGVVHAGLTGCEELLSGNSRGGIAKRGQDGQAPKREKGPNAREHGPPPRR